MMNIVRREPFTLRVTFEGDAEALRDFTLCLSQRGRILLRKGRADAHLREDGQCALIGLSGAETAALSPYEPAYAQVRAELEGGEALFSEVEEFNVVDVLDGQGGGKWS